MALLSAIRLAPSRLPGAASSAQFVEQFAGRDEPDSCRSRTASTSAWLCRGTSPTSRKPDHGEWAQAVDLTSHRAGLDRLQRPQRRGSLASVREATAVGGMALKDKVKELVMYAISPTYFEPASASRHRHRLSHAQPARLRTFPFNLHFRSLGFGPRGGLCLCIRPCSKKMRARRCVRRRN